MRCSLGGHIDIFNVTNLPVEQHTDVDVSALSRAQSRSQVKALAKKKEADDAVCEYVKKLITNNATQISAQ